MASKVNFANKNSIFTTLTILTFKQMSFLAHYISKTATLNACFLILYIIYIYMHVKYCYSKTTTKTKRLWVKEKNHKGNLTLLKSQYKEKERNE